MLYFPQLHTGALGQFPLKKTRRVRTVVNRLEDGSEIRLADEAGTATEWELTLRGLLEAEWGAIEDLFDATEGRAGTFVFLDPSANLLAHSEDLEAAVWSADPMLTVTAGIPDPFGTERATRLTNAGQAAQRIVQALSAPGDYEYCLSVWVRGSGQAGLVRGGHVASHGVGSRWVRLEDGGSGAASGDEIAFGIELPAGATVDVFGFQAEAQPAASIYKKTLASTGVHGSARFSDDVLTVTADGPGNYSVVLRVTSKD